MRVLLTRCCVRAQVRHKQKRKMEFLVDDIIDARSLTYEEWMNFILGNEVNKIFPNNCFPNDDIQNKYLENIENFTDEDVKNLLRRFLVRTGNFGSDDFFAKVLIKGKDEIEIFQSVKKSEYVRRLLSKEPTWEGITWILDLLPAFPNEALKGLDAYFLANCQFLPDYSLNGLSDVSLLINAKFIDYEHPQEIFLNLKPNEFGNYSAKLKI